MDELTDTEVAIRIISMNQDVEFESIENPANVMVHAVECIELMVEATLKSDKINMRPALTIFALYLGGVAELLKLAIENTSKTPTEKQHVDYKKYIKAAENQLGQMLGVKSRAGAKKENAQLILFKMAKLLSKKSDLHPVSTNMLSFDIVDHAAALVAKDMGISKRTVTRHWKAYKDLLKLPIWKKHPWFDGLSIQTPVSTPD